jgi:hypothetical protein
MLNKHAITELIFLSRHWTVNEAMWVLWCYRSDCTQLWWRKFWTTASSIEATEGAEKMANSVPVKFQGGPDRLKTYEGSFAMFVVDRALWAVKERDTSISWLLNFDPESGAHIKNQLKSRRPIAVGYRNKKFYFGDERDDHYERDDLLSHYEGGERVTDYVQVGDSVIPILESGRQGVAMKTTDNNDGRVARWSSSGKVNV